MLTQQQAITLFQSLIEQAKQLRDNSIRNGRPTWEGLERWRTVTEDSIAQVFGEGSRNLLKFQGIRYVPLRTSENELVAFIVGLDIAIERLEGMLISIQLWWQSNIQWFSNINIFISCGGSAKKTLLPKLKELLLALGITPIIVEEQPNYNLSLLDKVNAFLNLCNAGIALITAEDLTKDGQLKPRDNVVHEIGLMQQNANIGGRIIYLKERRVTLPSNFNQVVWVEFDRRNFEASYTALIKNIRTFLTF